MFRNHWACMVVSTGSTTRHKYVNRCLSLSKAKTENPLPLSKAGGRVTGYGRSSKLLVIRELNSTLSAYNYLAGIHGRAIKQ